MRSHLVFAAVMLLAGCICVPSNISNPFTQQASTTTTEAVTTTTSPPPAPTTSLTDSTSTTVSITTTTAKKTTTTTASTTTTTTTLAGSCSTTADCGGIRTYLSCNNNKVLRYEENPTCQHSPDGSKCVSSMHSTIVEACESGEYCVNATCKRVTEDDNSVHTVVTLTTGTTVKATFITTSTTTMTITPATFCWARTYARNQNDCDGLICRGNMGTCKYVGEGDTGHCTCG